MKKAASQATEPAESNPISDADRERLLRDIYRLDMEKFKLFTEMLRRNALLKLALFQVAEHIL